MCRVVIARLIALINPLVCDSNTIIAGIDWLSVTDTIGTTPTHYSIEGIDNWKQINGRLGYDKGLKHVTGVTRLSSSTRRDMGVHSIYTGKAMKRIEKDMKVTPMELLKHHLANHDNVARIDFSLDFINCGIVVNDFVDAWYAGNVITRAKSATYVKSITHAGSTFYVGSQKKRKKLLRVYDKGAEQGMSDVDWLRVELQIMGKPATTAGKGLVSSVDKPTYIAQAIAGYADFRTILPFQRAKNGDETIEIGSISSNKGDTRDWLENSVIPSLAREIVADSEYWVQFCLKLDSEIGRLKNV